MPPQSRPASRHARPTNPRVTVVNDNPDFLELMQDLLQDASYPATLIDGDRDDAMALIEASRPDVLVIDLRLGTDRLHGLDTVRAVRRHPILREVPAILCTADHWGLEQVNGDLEAIERLAVLRKPFAIAELYTTIDDALGR